MILDQEITFLPGVGPKKAELLNKELEIFTFKDLLHYFPYKYIDRTKFYKVKEINPDLPYIQIKGRIISIETTGTKTKQRLSAIFEDETGTVELVWFKGIKWIKSELNLITEYVIFGKPTLFASKYNIVHPEIENIEKFDAKINSSLQAVYHTSEKMKSSFLPTKAILNLQNTLIKKVVEEIRETLPTYIRDEHHLLSLKESLINIHFPTNTDILKKAIYRLKFEELFFIQLNILQKKQNRHLHSKGFIFNKIGDYFNNFYNTKLPFELTNAQKRVVKEIRIDIGSGKHMNRLLQGDVGSGKTLVALMTMLIGLDNGFQACIMAPTAILAQQHFVSISKFIDGLDIEIALLTGASRKKEREIIHKDLLSGKLQILVGTHALIEDVVQFKNLGIVIIDEQHRFGVEQRSKLWQKNINPPHVLVMTATPIPRTLAMTLYGDLSVSVIDELPPGRKPIITRQYFDSKRLLVFGFIKKQIELGRQIYIVYPLIKESETMDYKDLEDGVESILRAFPPPKYSLSVVHGKMKQKDKDLSMKYFVDGNAQILIATTVIEVGVDVPNATTMIIESAERFGLSQLHQLRGRVGRGGEQSYCLLMTSYKLSVFGKKRIQTMVETNDGFEISEADLKLRGPGDIEGKQQSGIPFNLRIANLAKDGQLLQYVRDIASEIIDKDPNLESDKNLVLFKQLNQIKKDKTNWGLIS